VTASSAADRVDFSGINPQQLRKRISRGGVLAGEAGTALGGFYTPGRHHRAPGTSHHGTQHAGRATAGGAAHPRVIEQAKGMLAEYLPMTVDEAFGLLRKYARDHNRGRSRAAQKLTRRQVRPPSSVSSSWPTNPLAAGPWMTTPSLAVVNPRSAQPCPPSSSVSGT